jgi:hypothetical protein
LPITFPLSQTGSLYVLLFSCYFGSVQPNHFSQFCQTHLHIFKLIPFQLSRELVMVSTRQGAYSKLASTKSMKDGAGSSSDLAKSGRELVKQGLSSGSLAAAAAASSDELPPNWQPATSPDGKVSV